MDENNITFMQWLNDMFSWSPGGLLIPAIGMLLGLLWGLFIYGRSFKYLYCYYIEHGVVLCAADNYLGVMKDVKKKYGLNENFRPFGYITGMITIIFTAILGFVAGALWPVTLVITILTVPNFILRRVAKEKRAKVVFQQNLQGKK